MTQQTEQELIARVLAHLARGTTDLAAAQGYAAATEYTEPAQHERELAALFRRRPVAVAPSAALGRPGDFQTVDDYGLPLLLTRDKAGRAHVLVNACRHRGTRLVSTAQGSNRPSFVCPYHAWTYGGDGALLKVSHAGCFPAVRPEEYGLIELPSWESLGFLWAVLTPGTRVEPDRTFTESLAESFAASLGGLAPELEALTLDRYTVYAPYERRWRANWKILVEGGLEAYHFRVVHRDSIYPMFHDNFMLHDRCGDHQRLVLPKRSIAELSATAVSDRRLRQHANLVYLLFPNLMLLVQQDHVVAVQIYPTACAESRIVLTMLLPEPPATERAAAHWAKNRAITIAALDEDFAIGEQVDAGLRSGLLDRMTFGRNELGLTAFHESLARSLC